MRILLAIILAAPIAVVCMICGLNPLYGVVAGGVTAAALGD